MKTMILVFGLIFLLSSCSIVKDTEEPVISIIGEPHLVLEIAEPYIELGVETSDNSGAEPIVIITGEVDITMVGLYTLTYTATDKAGNSSFTTRVVEVIDTVSPYIELIGDRFVYIELGSEYIDPGILIIENSAEILTVQVYSSLDVNKLSYYELDFYVVDSSGNVSNTVSRGVITTPPYHGLYDSLISMGWEILSLGVVYDTLITTDINNTIIETITYTYDKNAREFSYTQVISTISDIDHATIVSETVYTLVIDLVNGRGYVEFTTKSYETEGTITDTDTLEYDYYNDTVINVSDTLMESDLLQLLRNTTIEFNNLLYTLYSIQIIDFY
jgi:hypothetical protein